MSMGFARLRYASALLNPYAFCTPHWHAQPQGNRSALSLRQQRTPSPATETTLSTHKA